MSPENTDSIVSTLRKLLAHQMSAKAIGNVAEAAAFGAKVQELLNKYKLTLSDTQAKEEEKTGASPSTKVWKPKDFGMKVNANNQYIGWIAQLAKIIAECNDCRALSMPEIAKTIRGRTKLKNGKPYEVISNSYIFVGVEADRLVVEQLFVYMCQLAWDMACQNGDDLREGFRREIIHQYGECVPVRLSRRQHNFRHSFCNGFAAAVCERLVASREAMKQAAESKVTALVLVDRRLTLVNNWVQKHTAKAAPEQYARHRTEEDTLGWALGVRAGNNVALTSKTVS